MADMTAQVTAWAEVQPEIRALLLVGSRARREFPADEWADYDFECFVTALPVDYHSAEWASAFGEVWTYLPTMLEVDIPHPLVVYAGGIKVDFSFTPLRYLEQAVGEAILSDSQQRGYQVLVDKDGLAAKLVAPAAPSFVPPSAQDFHLAMQGFWMGAVYVAQQIRRRNLWVVKYRDWTMKIDLLRMLEWRHHSTWHDGHFLSQWAKEHEAALYASFGHYDDADSWAALRQTMRLFQMLARKIAQDYGFDYPDALAANVQAYVDALWHADET